MTALRSLAYHVLFLLTTLVLSSAYVPMLLGSRKAMQKAAWFWLECTLFLQRHVLGLDFECRGLANLPKGPVIVAAKHQSAWDTMVFHRLVPDPAYILKKELLSLPLVGWHLSKTGQIAIDRKGGAKALKAMVERAKAAAAEDRQIIIFPEGHRQAPGETGDYHAGVAMLRSALGLPVVPVAVNSGLFWGRNAFLHRPGRIVIEFLPPIPPELDRKAFMETLRNAIETRTRALETEALARFPHLPAPGIPG